MKIGIDCHTVGSQVGGNETYAVNLVRALARIDAENEYRLYVTRPGPEVSSLAAAPNFTLVHLWPRTPMVRIPVSLPAELWRHPVDVLHVQYILPPFGRTPVVNTVHDLAPFSFPEFFRRREVWRQRLLLPRSVRRAARVLTDSRYCQEEIVRTFGVPPNRVEVIYLGVSEDFRPVDGPERDLVLSRYGIPRPYLLYVGNIQPRKNIRGVLDAFATLKRRGLPHRLVIVGRRAWLHADTLARAHELALEPDIVWTSYVPYAHLPALYSGADALVYPSFYEGFGAPPLEAMACGTPVVAARRAAFPEILGDAALLVDPADPGDIARGVLAVVQDRALRESLIARGRERARRYRWEETARRTLEVFRKVAGSRVGTPA